jgi:hypothetical protein
MAWFRTNRGLVAWLAFFALACQLTLTFGHVHIGKFSTGLIAPAAGTQTADTTPTPQNGPAGSLTDFCAVCANISLAGSLILPVILALILSLRLFTNMLRWPLAAFEPASFAHRPFSARGPPLHA